MRFRENSTARTVEREAFRAARAAHPGFPPVASGALTDLLWAVECLRGEVRTLSRTLNRTRLVRTQESPPARPGPGTVSGTGSASAPSSPRPDPQHTPPCDTHRTRTDAGYDTPTRLGEKPAGLGVVARRESLTAERDALEAERDALQAERECLAAERDALKAERDTLRVERDSLRAEIGTVHRELSFLISRNEEGDRLTVAGNELRAVVSTTEDATGTILGASEILMGLLRDQTGCQAASSDTPGSSAGVTAAESLVVAIMEACTFQDLTGQRINKVVTALRFLEEHIRAMVDLFGEDALPPPEAAAVPEDDESRLLNGPQDKERSISQAEIDALFG